ncbi:hypothetical protein D3C72_1276800 [compost metagenome]
MPGDADIDVTVHDFAVHGSKFMLGRVEVGTHVAGIQQLAVQFECPFMVRAYQLGHFALGFGTDFGAPVAAGIMEGTYYTVLAAHYDNRVFTDLQRQVFARLFHFESVAGEDPFLVPDVLEVLLIEHRVHIGGARQTVLRLALFDQV